MSKASLFWREYKKTLKLDSWYDYILPIILWAISLWVTYKIEGEDKFIDDFVRWLGISTLVVIPYLVFLGIFHLCRLDLYIKIHEFENQKRVVVTENEMRVGRLVEMVVNFNQNGVSFNNLSSKCNERNAYKYLVALRALPRFFEKRGVFDRFLAYYTLKEAKEGDVLGKFDRGSIYVNFNSGEEASTALPEIKRLAQALVSVIDS